MVKRVVEQPEPVTGADVVDGIDGLALGAQGAFPSRSEYRSLHVAWHMLSVWLYLLINLELGVTVERVMTANGSAYRLRAGVACVAATTFRPPA